MAFETSGRDLSGKMSSKSMVPCPYCGELIKSNAKACSHCGSDENTGWSDSTYLNGIDLDDDFNYDELVKDEFSMVKRSLPWWKSWKKVVALVMLILFVFMILRAIV